MKINPSFVLSLLFAVAAAAAPGPRTKAAPRDPRLDPLRRAAGTWDARVTCEGNFLGKSNQHYFRLEDQGDQLAAVRLRGKNGRMNAWGPVKPGADGTFHLRWDVCDFAIKIDERANSASYSTSCKAPFEGKGKDGVIKMSSDWTSGEAIEHDSIKRPAGADLVSECRIVFTKL